MSGFLFVYNDDLVMDKFISYSAKNKSPQKIIKEICDQVEISHKLFGINTIVLFKETPPEEVEENKNVIKISPTPVVSNLQVLSSNQPKYPSLAVSDNIQGSVTIKMLVSKIGQVEKVEIDKSSGSKILDDYTVAFVKNLIFKPLVINNIPRASYTYITYSYILTKN